MKKQDKIDLMKMKILKSDSTPVIFDPFLIDTDCLMLWERFSLDHFTEVRSYVESNDWIARRFMSYRDNHDAEVSAVAHSMREAMCDCMFKASQLDDENHNY